MDEKYLNDYLNLFIKYGFIRADRRVRFSKKVWLIIWSKKYNIYIKAYNDGMVRLYKFWGNNPYMNRWEAYQLNKKLKLATKLDQLKYIAHYIITNKKYYFN